MFHPEYAVLTSQIVILKPDWGGRRTLSDAFTERSVIIAANPLNSIKVIEMSV